MNSHRPVAPEDSTVSTAGSATATAEPITASDAFERPIRTKEAAEMLNVSKATIVIWCNSGVLPHFKQGNVILISPIAVRNLVPTK